MQAAVGATILVVILSTLSRDETEAEIARPAESSEGGPRLDPVRTPRPTGPARRRAGPALPAPSPAFRSLSGRVLDLAGRGLAGVELYLEPGVQEAARPVLDETDFEVLQLRWLGLGKADEQGSFRVGCPVADGLIRVGASHVTVRSWRVFRRNEAVEKALIVAAPAVEVAGSVVDGEGNGLEGASIRGWCPTLSGFPVVLDGTRRLVAGRGTSDSGGRFRLRRMPASPALELVFSRPGYRTARRRVRPEERTSLYVILEEPERGEWFTISGHVFDRRGDPVAGASVGLGGRMSRSDGRGAYKLELEQVGPDAILYAAKEGHRGVLHEDIAMELAGLEGQTLAKDLFLGPPALSIEGRVVDAGGRPLSDHLVYLVDPRFLDRDTLSLEALSAGVERDPYGVRSRTDGKGRFELTGLDARSYRLRVLREVPPFAMDVGPFPAGSKGLRIRVPARAMRRELLGRVVGHDALPLEGASVRYSVAIRGDRSRGSFVSSQPVTTDARGAFRLEDVPAKGAWLTLGGEGVEPLKLDVPPEGSAPLWIVAARRCHFRIEAPRAPAGTYVRMLDGEGNELLIRRFEADGHSRGNRWALDGGRSEVLAVSERATTVVFGLGEKELHRQPLFLVSGRVNVVEWN